MQSAEEGGAWGWGETPTTQPWGVQRPSRLLAGGAGMRGVSGPRPSDREMSLTAASCPRTHAGTHTSAHTCAHTSAHTRAHTSAHTCMHTWVHTHTHTCTHEHTHMHTQRHSHIDTRRFHCRCQTSAPTALLLSRWVPTEGCGPWGISIAQRHPQIPTSVAPRAACLMGAWREEWDLCL